MGGLLKDFSHRAGPDLSRRFNPICPTGGIFPKDMAHGVKLGDGLSEKSCAQKRIS
jgi:hypothetical protein